MAPPPVPDNTYVCPRCGQKAVIGTHFCQPFEPPVKPAPVKRPPSASKRRALYTILGVAVAVMLLWRWTGPASLVLVALGLLVFLLFVQPRTGKGNQAKHDASSPGSAVENKDLSTDSKSESKTPSSPPGKSKR